MVPRLADRPFFDTGGGVWESFGVQSCYATIKDTASPSSFHWARFSIPVTPGNTIQNNLTATVSTLANVNQTMCSTVYTYTSSGALSTSVNLGCNNYTPPSACASAGGYAPCLAQVDLSGTLTLPGHGSVLIDVAGKNSTEIRRISIKYGMTNY